MNANDLVDALIKWYVDQIHSADFRQPPHATDVIIHAASLTWGIQDQEEVGVIISERVNQMIEERG